MLALTGLAQSARLSQPGSVGLAQSAWGARDGRVMVTPVGLDWGLHQVRYCAVVAKLYGEKAF